MVYGRSTTQGYPPEVVSGMYPDMTYLNYQQQLTSIPPTFNQYSQLVSGIDFLNAEFKNKFGLRKKILSGPTQVAPRTIAFRKSGLSGSVNGVKYEVYPKKKIIIGNTILEVGSFINDTTFIKNIGPKQIILAVKGQKDKRIPIKDFVKY